MSFPQVLTGVAHIGIPTNDLDKTIAFYKKLGFVSALETVNKAAEERVAFLQLGDLMIETFPVAVVKGSIFPLHRSSRYPTRYTLRRDWGTPKSLLLSTCHSTPYPSRSSVWRIVANVRPPS